MTDSPKIKPMINSDIRLRKAAKELHDRVEDIVAQRRGPILSPAHTEEILYDVTRSQNLIQEMTYLLGHAENELRKDLGQDIDD